MNDDDNERFDVSFAGEILPGSTEHAVREALQQRFRLDVTALERLFSGRRQILKRHCDRATALKYQRALKQAGARPMITRAASAEPPGASAKADSPGLSLAEPGSDVLRPEERAVYKAVEIDTAHLQLDDSDAALSAPTPAAAPRPVPNLDLAEPGARLSPPQGDHPPAPIETQTIELVPGELDLGDCAPAAPPAPILNLEHLHLSAVGSALLADNERPRQTATVPDTTHLQLLADDDTPRE